MPSGGAPPRTVLVGGALAAALSGLPSTAWALATGGDPLAAARAAGTLLPGRRRRPGLAAGAVAHVAVSAFWTAVLAGVARRRPLGAGSGAVAGLAIAALDLELIGRRFPALAGLPRVPQWLDHALFGAILGDALRPRPAAGPPGGGAAAGG